MTRFYAGIERLDQDLARGYRHQFASMAPRAAGMAAAPTACHFVALRDATPQIGGNAGRAELPALQGEVPTATRVRKGCRFHPCRPLAFDRCKSVEPPLVEVGLQHMSACWLAK
ncbi:hypothetical protein DBIPINDM_003598 [Mesorhizobium sp. AR02]|uniref:oligopeptide/dipeptide ABC transporter ATP-binding protein n=1 Tax=Mesorhizobium sp. AR02 TaxID=2865837 RepID=UPI0021FC0B83|nr:oligopeptide/dipeptide ABC transporter ATP-binding protein [Mesorhizobium sp. AR02]UVK50445.1 hypothetical protein DBIPINDM_003598 [Mesorhizobium sp. AR02]